MKRITLKITALAFVIICSQISATRAQSFRAADNRSPLSNAILQTSNAVFLRAAFQTDENMPKRIAFAKGKSSATVSGTLRRTRSLDDAHYYVIRARAGQTLNMRVTASTGAAVISVGDPHGEQISEGGDDRFSQKLSASGDYRISVFNAGNGNLGNTRYALTVSIK